MYIFSNIDIIGYILYDTEYFSIPLWHLFKVVIQFLLKCNSAVCPLTRNLRAMLQHLQL